MDIIICIFGIKEKTIIMEKCDENLEQFLKKRNVSFQIEEIKKFLLI